MLYFMAKDSYWTSIFSEVMALYQCQKWFPLSILRNKR